MANKNTMRARKEGFASSKDLAMNGTKTFKGSTCDTSWDGKLSKKRFPKQYKKQ